MSRLYVRAIRQSSGVHSSGGRPAAARSALTLASAACSIRSSPASSTALSTGVAIRAIAGRGVDPDWSRGAAVALVTSVAAAIATPIVRITPCRIPSLLQLPLQPGDLLALVREPKRGLPVLARLRRVARLRIEIAEVLADRRALVLVRRRLLEILPRVVELAHLEIEPSERIEEAAVRR